MVSLFNAFIINLSIFQIKKKKKKDQAGLPVTLPDAEDDLSVEKEGASINNTTMVVGAVTMAALPPAAAEQLPVVSAPPPTVTSPPPTLTSPSPTHYDSSEHNPHQHNSYDSANHGNLVLVKEQATALKEQAVIPSG